MEQKTVFISYRREKSKHLARAIYQDLRMHGWDVFLDVTTIDSGDFDRIILNQIAARAHFILLISPGALERCASPGDWLRRAGGRAPISRPWAAPPRRSAAARPARPTGCCPARAARPDG